MENGSTITSATAGCFRMLWFIQVPGPRQNGESTEAPSSSHSTPISSTAALAGRKIMLVRSAPWTPTINMTLWSTSTFSWKEGNYQWPQLATGMIIIKHHPNRLPKWWIQPMGLKRTLAQQIHPGNESLVGSSSQPIIPRMVQKKQYQVTSIPRSINPLVSFGWFNWGWLATRRVATNWTVQWIRGGHDYGSNMINTYEIPHDWGMGVHESEVSGGKQKGTRDLIHRQIQGGSEKKPW